MINIILYKAKPKKDARTKAELREEIRRLKSGENGFNSRQDTCSQEQWEKNKGWENT